jgi:multiple sugar transport system ATP-binding protein
VLKDGIVQQVASPQEMYEHPVNVFVAGFIGSPAMNFIRARLEKENGEYAATFGHTRLPLSREVVEKSEGLEAFAGKEVVLGIRPEHIEDARLAEGQILGGTNDPNIMEIEPQVIESMGSEKYVYFGVPKDQAAHLESIEEIAGEEDSDAEGSGSADDFGDLMVARVSVESGARLGQKMQLAVDAAKIQLFDPESEKAII